MTRHDCRRCDWHPDPVDTYGPAGVQAATHAVDAEHPLCIVCFHSLELMEIQTCAGCVAVVRRHLTEVVEIYALLPETLGHPGSQRLDIAPGGGGDEVALPGGDALVMLAGGSAGRSQIRGVPLRGGHRSVEHELDEWETDAPSVAYELGRAEDDWRLVRGEPAAVLAGTVASAANYLLPRLGWAAAHHLAFDEFATDVRRLVSKLRTVAGTAERPVSGSPCLTCDTRVERSFRPRRTGHGCLGHWDRCDWPYEQHGCTDSGGLEDDWTCPGCGRVYTDQEYRLAVAQRHALASQGLVTAATVEETLGIKADRLRQWAVRGKVNRRGYDERGRTLYDTSEVRDHAMAVGCLP